MATIEADAVAHGVHHLSLTATLPGKRLYGRLGYRTRHPVDGQLSNGYSVRLCAMEKLLSHHPGASAVPPSPPRGHS